VNMKKSLIALVCATAVLAGCTNTRTEHVTTALPLPGRPELPRIPAEQLQCLADDAYGAIVTRDRRLREYAEQLEAVIRSTHEDQGQ